MAYFFCFFFFFSFENYCLRAAPAKEGKPRRRKFPRAALPARCRAPEPAERSPRSRRRSGAWPGRAPARRGGGQRPAGPPRCAAFFRCGGAGPTGARAPRLRGGARRAVRARPGAVGGSVFSRRCRQKEPGGAGACSLLLRSALRAVARRACVSIPCCCVFQVDK